MHWLLATLRRRVPGLPQRAAIDARFDRHFDAAAIGGELAYLARPATQSFERTYGWAWLLALAAELGRADDAAARRWSAALLPLADAFVAPLPRVAGHCAVTRSATATTRTARSGCCSRSTTRAARKPAGSPRDCVAAACRWYEGDADAPWRLEPSGADFLSPTLDRGAADAPQCCPAAAFAAWLERWLPGLAAGAPAGTARAGAGQRPQRSADRAPRRPQPVAGVVLARHRRGAAGGRSARGRWRRLPPRATSPPAATGSRATTTWARTGWRALRCWRSRAAAPARSRRLDTPWSTRRSSRWPHSPSSWRWSCWSRWPGRASPPCRGARRRGARSGGTARPRRGAGGAVVEPRARRPRRPRDRARRERGGGGGGARRARRQRRPVLAGDAAAARRDGDGAGRGDAALRRAPRRAHAHQPGAPGGRARDRRAAARRAAQRELEEARRDAHHRRRKAAGDAGAAPRRVVQAGVRPARAGAQGAGRDADARRRRRRPEARAGQRQDARRLGRGATRHAARRDADAGAVRRQRRHPARQQRARRVRDPPARQGRRGRAVLAADRRQVPARPLAAAAGCAGARRPRRHGVEPQGAGRVLPAGGEEDPRQVRRAAAHDRFRDPVRADRRALRRDDGAPGLRRHAAARAARAALPGR